MMANSGIKAEQAGTSLRSLLTRLSTNAGASANSLGALDILTQRLGVSFYDSSGNARDLSDVLVETRAAWAGLNVEEQVNYAKKMAGQEAMTGFLALMSDGAISIESVATAIDLSEIACSHGGGGHVKAAGCNMSGDPEKIVAEIVADIEKQLG